MVAGLSCPIPDDAMSCQRAEHGETGGSDAITLEGAASEPLRPYRIVPDGLDPLSAHILVEPRNGARPCLLGRDLIVAFRRRAIEEPMNRIRVNVAFVPDVAF